MEMALTFNGITLSPIPHQNSPWIRSVELARALGYSDESSVGRIYKRNSEEFTPEMTQVIEISDTVNLTVPTRIFSLRGCHLVAMFARTPVAKAFRRNRSACPCTAMGPSICPLPTIPPTSPGRRKKPSWRYGRSGGAAPGNWSSFSTACRVIWMPAAARPLPMPFPTLAAMPIPRSVPTPCWKACMPPRIRPAICSGRLCIPCPVSFS